MSYMMEMTRAKITVRKTTKTRISEVDFNNIPFGRIFSDHMLVADYAEGKWKPAEIIPYDRINVYPCISALHYGQSIFEGLKAFRMDDGGSAIFRPRDNFQRMNRSALGLEMPEIPEEIFMDGLQELVRLDQQWIPDTEGSSLYIRPIYFATDEYIGIKTGESFKFIIFTCPVGNYYPEPVRLWMTKKFVRAYEGGTGEIKMAGNYAASMKAAKIARDNGYHNVLWLDGREHKYIEECGTMNIFFVIGDTVVTPALTGTILNGVTRNSCLTLLRDEGIKVEERRLSIDEVIEANQNGTLKECFGTGTAATVAPVAKIGMEDRVMMLPPVEERKIGKFLLQKINGIRNGTVEDKYGWMTKI